jgi:hypothetical protein
MQREFFGITASHNPQVYDNEARENRPYNYLNTLLSIHHVVPIKFCLKLLGIVLLYLFFCTFPLGRILKNIFNSDIIIVQGLTL